MENNGKQGGRAQEGTLTRQEYQQGKQQADHIHPPPETRALQNEFLYTGQQEKIQGKIEAVGKEHRLKLVKKQAVIKQPAITEQEAGRIEGQQLPFMRVIQYQDCTILRVSLRVPVYRFPR